MFILKIQKAKSLLKEQIERWEMNTIHKPNSLLKIECEHKDWSVMYIKGDSFMAKSIR